MVHYAKTRLCMTLYIHFVQVRKISQCWLLLQVLFVIESCTMYFVGNKQTNTAVGSSTIWILFQFVSDITSQQINKNKQLFTTKYFYLYHLAQSGLPIHIFLEHITRGTIQYNLFRGQCIGLTLLSIMLKASIITITFSFLSKSSQGNNIS